MDFDIFLLYNKVIILAPEANTLKKLWYDHPAEAFTQALPLGNGRLGVMAFGGIHEERLHLNEDSVWSGGPRNRINPSSVKSIEKIRRLIRSGQIASAQKLARLALSGTPVNQRAYQTAGELLIDFDNPVDPSVSEINPVISNYKRELDIEDAVYSLSFESGGIEYTRTAFVSAADNIAVMRLSCSQKGALSFTARLGRGIFLDRQFTADDNTIAIEITQGIPFCVMAKAIALGGEINCFGGVIRVDNADEVLIFVDIETSFRHEDYCAECLRVISNASKKTFYELFHAHADDYKYYYNRLSIDLGGDDLCGVPTDVRLSGFARGNEDNGLISLFYQYGRYLMISSCRPGTLPATLQGIWNDQLDPPFGSRYTLNGSTEMTYLSANMCNLHEFRLPLFEHLKRMLENGRKVARDMYGVGGFVCHNSTDIMGDCAPEADIPSVSYRVFGAARLCAQIWEHYEYTIDRRFLSKYYPVMREAAQFFIEYLREDSRGRLVVVPSASPESFYRHKSGDIGCLCEGCTMDHQILRNLIKGCINAEKVLEISDGISGTLEYILTKMPETSANSNGIISEWCEEFDKTEDDFGHISQLYGLFPSNEISILHTPELAEAARTTLRQHYSVVGHTGCESALAINLWAKLHDAEKAYESLKTILNSSVYPNLFGSNPHFNIYDNLGADTGITQMIIQSNDNDIILLPALPKEWSSGSLRGVCLKNGVTADLAWHDGKIAELSLRCSLRRRVTLYNNGAVSSVELSPGCTKLI